MERTLGNANEPIRVARSVCIAAPTRAACALAVIAALSTAFTPTLSHADDQTWSFRLTPYLWAPSLNMDTSIGPDRTAESSTSLLEALDFGFLAMGEARKGPWGVIAEFNYLALSDEATLLQGLVQTDTKLNGVMGGAAVAYRGIGNDAAGIDVFGGFRIWSLKAKIEPRLLPSVEAESTFIDPVFGLRGTYDITPHVFLSGLGDIGGFGVGSDFQWEVLGRVSYRLADNLTAGIGYRHLALNVDRGRLDVDAALSGPFAAFDITW